MSKYEFTMPYLATWVPATFEQFELETASLPDAIDFLDRAGGGAIVARTDVLGDDGYTRTYDAIAYLDEIRGRSEEEVLCLLNEKIDAQMDVRITQFDPWAVDGREPGSRIGF